MFISKDKKTVVIIQARMGSVRFAGKVAHAIQNRSILSHCIERLRRIDSDTPVVVATSQQPQDDEVAQIAKNEKVFWFRGSHEDVLDRYYRAAVEFKADYIIRATADNPFVDTREGRRVFWEINTGRWDYVSMLEEVDDRKLPVGAGLEAFTFAALKRSWQEGRLDHHREHVNEYILENTDKFRTKILACDNWNSCPELSLTIDTAEDLMFINHMLEDMGRVALELETSEIIEWWQNAKVKS